MILKENKLESWLKRSTTSYKNNQEGVKEVKGVSNILGDGRGKVCKVSYSKSTRNT